MILLISQQQFPIRAEAKCLMKMFGLLFSHLRSLSDSRVEITGQKKISQNRRRGTLVLRNTSLTWKTYPCLALTVIQIDIFIFSHWVHLCSLMLFLIYTGRINKLKNHTVPSPVLIFYSLIYKDAEYSQLPGNLTGLEETQDLCKSGH